MIFFMIKRLWLTFAQAVTLLLAVLFVVSAFKPEWLPGRFQMGPQTGSAVAPPTPPNVNAATQTSGVNNSPRQPEPAERVASASILSYGQAAKTATPAVVNIVASKRSRVPSNHPLLEDPFFKRFFGDQLPSGSNQRPQRPAPAAGSGVIVDANGTVMTNHHVVEGAEELQVVLADGRKAVARVLGTDPDTDLAVLKIELPNLQAISFGDSETAQVGDVVLAIGNPFGVGQTVTMGIVSATGRNQLGINNFENFIQTDAAINPGNSGGALVDSSGRLLGINTAIFSQSGGSLGIGFAIPVTTAKQVLNSILKDGRVIRGFLGVSLGDLTTDGAKEQGINRTDGAFVSRVEAGSPAEKAGIKVKDLLVSVNGKRLPNVVSALNTISQLTPGQSAKFTLVRNDKELEVAVLVGTRPRDVRRPVEQQLP
jgi:serine protease DegQ